jgi:hypothetical protein
VGGLLAAGTVVVVGVLIPAVANFRMFGPPKDELAPAEAAAD